MSATTIRELLVKLGVSDTGASIKGVADLDAALDGLVEVATRAVAVVVGVSAAVAGLAAMSAGAGDSIDKNAQAAAISTDAYQELSFVASQAGTDIELVTKALGKQTTALKQLEDGAGPAADALQSLGLGYADLAGLSPDQQLEATSAAIASVADEQERLQLATAIYGEEMAQRLMPLLNLGADGIGALRDQAHDLGLVMTEESVASAVLFTDTLDQLWTILTGVRNAIGLALLPILTDLIARVRDWYTANAQLIQARLEAWVNVLVASIGALVRWVELADEAVRRTMGGWGPILATAVAAFAAVAAVVATIAGLQAWTYITGAIAAIGTIGLATFGQIVAAVLLAAAAVVGLFLALDDLLTYLRGGESALGAFLDRFREADGYLGAAARTLEAIIAIGGRVVDIVMQIGEIWWAVFQVTSLPVLQAVGSALLWVAEAGLGAIAWWADNVVIPALNMVLSLLDAMSSGLAAVGGVLGIEVGGSASGGDAGVSSVVAPDVVAGAAAASSSSTSSSTSVQVQGSNLTVNGVGISGEEALDLMRQLLDEQARQTAAALAGAEV